MISITQYKTDPHNTTYTKLAQVDTGNTIYTNVVFYYRVSFVSLRMQYAKNRACKKYKPLYLLMGKKTYQKVWSFSIFVCIFVP
jgi:hypothetical protein